ncbi:MAG: DUF4234 domain-containing protein [Clostridia bacterium]|nr:DUF4234 domain-containing protein [Clostridia bacterium]MBR4799446.1 DUF4234 domain-containing protein [Clostridia bacterium]
MNGQYNQNGNYYPPANLPAVKNIAVAIILSIVTCGIYAFYWMYTLNDDVAALTGRAPRQSGGLVVLLTIVTFGIYGIIWMYNEGQDIDEIKNRMGVPSSNTGIIYLVLSLLGFSIVALALMQNEVNNVVSGRYNYQR